MIFGLVEEVLKDCFIRGVERGFWPTDARGLYKLEEPKNKAHGDFSTNMALVIGGLMRQPPRQLAVKIADLLRERIDIFRSVDIAGPGFVNLSVHDEFWQKILPRACGQGDSYGLSESGAGKKVLVEFVSANPTGPLSVGHGRQAALGDAVARLLIATGHGVTREYYYNDAGRQMRVLGESTRARYLELLDRPACFPEDGYQGEYIRDIGRQLVEEYKDSLVDTTDVTPFKAKAEAVIFADIKNTLSRLGIEFDSYYNEHSLYENGKIDEVVGQLRVKGLVYEHEGAVWFKTSELGLEKDRVIIKNTGEPTYRLPDIAYHQEKYRRGFDWMVNIFGADHIATVPDVLAGIRALGYDDQKVTTVIHQFVTLTRGGKQVKMSTRKATFVTVDELIDEVGSDVVRFFFLMRKADSQLEFDLDLARQQSQENPVYYVQYAHARLASIARQASERGIKMPAIDESPLFQLSLPEEIRLLKYISGFPRLVQGAALSLEPHRIIFFLMELVGEFHSYYNKHRIISEDISLTQARLCLSRAIKIVINNGLTLVGVSAPDVM